jgi:hypothetical protein
MSHRCRSRHCPLNTQEIREEKVLSAANYDRLENRKRRCGRTSLLWYGAVMARGVADGLDQGPGLVGTSSPNGCQSWKTARSWNMIAIPNRTLGVVRLATARDSGDYPCAGRGQLGDEPCQPVYVVGLSPRWPLGRSICSINLAKATS